MKSPFFYLLTITSVTGLSKISIGLKPYQYQYVDPYTDQIDPTPITDPPPVPEEEIPAFRTLDIENIKIPLEWQTPTPAYQVASVESTASISPADVKPLKPKLKPKKRKTTRKSKPKRKPKKMHLRRVFKTRLITTTPRLVIEENRIDEEAETTTNLINLAPIYDVESGVSYTQTDLNKICSETVSVSKGFGISDIESFAKNNCFLIRLYYPSVTCSQINQLVGYCTENGLM